MPDDRCRMTEIHRRPLSVVRRLSSVDHQLWTINYRLSTTNYQPSYYLKIPLPFPITHLGAEFPPFPFPGLGEMLHKGLSKQLLGNRGILHLGRGIFEIGGKAAVLVIPIAVAHRVGHL